MFSETELFNQPLDAWNVANVKDMSHMFYRAVSFRQSLHIWSVAPVTNINHMFDSTFDVLLRPPGRRFGVLPDTVPFEEGGMDQLPLPTLLYGLHKRLPIDVCLEVRRTLWEPLTEQTIADAVREWKSGSNSRWGPIELWDVRQVTYMDHLFDEEHDFNADLSRWDVSNVKSMAAINSTERSIPGT